MEDRYLVRKKILKIKPTLRGNVGVGNFDSKYTSEEVVTSGISPKSIELIKNKQEKFEDFENNLNKN